MREIFPTYFQQRKDFSNVKVKPIIWHRPNADGSCAIRLYAYHNGKKRYFSTGLSVDPKHWDAKKGVVKKTHSLHEGLNATIRKHQREIEDRLIKGSTLDGVRAKQVGLIEFANTYIEEVKMGRHGIRLSTCRNYEFTRNRLNEYAAIKGIGDLQFEDIDIAFYHDFCNYLAKNGCGRPGTSKHIQILKKFMNEGLARKLHENADHKKFKVYKQPATNKIWLNEEDVSKLENLNLSSQPAMERERDRWLISYYFIMRYSDSIAIRRSKFFERDGDRYIRYASEKTGIEVTIPVKPCAWEILEKYRFDFSGGDTIQEANRKLKVIGAMAGIVEETREGEKVAPKCSFISTHTARRSAATQMYLQNVSLQIIAKLGGWNKLDTLKLYLKASGIDVAMMARDLDFFK